MLDSADHEYLSLKPRAAKSVVFLLFSLTVLLVSSMDIYVPIAPQLATLFAAPESFIKLTFLVGPLASALVGIPAGFLSDRHGRRPLVLASLLLYWLGTLFCTLVPSFSLFFFGRVVQSLGVGSLLVLNSAILSDLYSGTRLARTLGLYALLFPLTFAAAPLIGAQVYTWFGWRAMFVLLLLGVTPISLLLIWLLPETCEGNKESQILPSLRKLAASKLMLCLALTHALPARARTPAGRRPYPT